VDTTVGISERQHLGRSGPGCAACAWGVVFGAISLYWGAGSRIGLDTLGGSLERQALAGDRVVLAAAWVTGVLKLVGAALALTLVRPWGPGSPGGCCSAPRGRWP
jgi:hypothetical protein